VQIELWSDFACPWCAVGLYRLEAALEKFGHGDDVTVIHRAFELDPHAPARRAQSMNEVLAQKYGMNPAQVRAGHERLAAMGREVGMDFQFDRVQLGNTFDAHRLARADRGTDAEESLVKGLFGAYFTHGQLLSDPEVLLRVAEEAGFDRQAAAAVLAGDAHGAEVRADETAAHERGITGVPHFLIDGEWAVPGAQDVETLLHTLHRAWERSQGLSQGRAAAG
jgi:predicted DsbA family dithiol-disulfide isomerase